MGEAVVRTAGLPITWVAPLVFVLMMPMPAAAFELSGGVSLGGFQVGTLPRLARSASNMIELNFTSADGPILIQIYAPVSTPESKWPWTVEVRTNGRSQMVVGEDPLEALEMAIQFTAAYVSDREGLDPFVKPPVPPAAKIT